MPVTIQLPDTLRNWPWPLRNISPYYDECKSEFQDWAESFRAFSPKAQKAFNECDFSLCGALAYAGLNKDGYRVACDVTNLFFVFDEWTDVADPVEAREYADIIMDALYNPHSPRPQGEWVGGEMARQFWANAICTGTPSFQRRFLKGFHDYTDATVQQAIDRSKSHIRTIDSYFPVRRLTVGLMPSFAVNEIHFNIPEYVMQNEVTKRLQTAVVDMIIIENDLYSYNVEQARGDDLHNLITIVMHQYSLSIQDAINWIAKLFDEKASEFLNAYHIIPSWGAELDDEVKLYVDALGYWVRAYNQWCFESRRYFGKDGLHIQKV